MSQKFLLEATDTITYHISIEANSLEEARQIAETSDSLDIHEHATTGLQYRSYTIVAPEQAIDDPDEMTWYPIA